MSELLIKSESLVAVADSIRAKTGATEELVFPEGFVEAVEGISAVDTEMVDRLDELETWKAENEDLVQMIRIRCKMNGAAYLFTDCVTLAAAPLFDTSNVTTMDSMFNNCTALTTVPEFDTSNVTNMSRMFAGCESLTETPLFDTSNVKIMEDMFNGCVSLTTVSEFDTSNVTNMSRMFAGCTSLTTAPLFDTKNVTTMESMFLFCSSLTTVPEFDTSNVTGTHFMFSGCTSLTTVPPFDMRNVTGTLAMFDDCASLSECWLRNIKADLEVGSRTSWGHLLTVESLLHLIKECLWDGYSHTLTIGTANLEKLANIYVRFIDVTDEMRAEDDLIDDKRPFEVCENTDEGAMLITDYAQHKGWQLK